MPWSQMIRMNIRPPRATADMKLDNVPNVNARTLNSDSLNIGWAIRLSTTANAISRPMPPTSSAITCGFCQPIG